MAGFGALFTKNTPKIPQVRSAKEAAAELNINLATLYAYVSRGILQSEARTGTRARRYLVTEIRALAEKTRVSALPSASNAPLFFGPPVLDSAITFTDGQRLYFRGHDVALLAKTGESLESIAGLIWDCDAHVCFAVPPPALLARHEAFRAANVAEDALVQAQALLPLIGQQDVRAYDFSQSGVARTGAVILRLMASLVAATTSCPAPVHEVLASGWSIESEALLLRSALILAADHELNASSFAVRVVASASASPYQAVAAGLATLQGARHGGEIERTYRLLQEIKNSLLSPDAVVADWMRRGDVVAGFGHNLYPKADPRAQALLEMMRVRSKTDKQADILRVIDVVQAVVGKALNFDGALALLTMYLDLPASAGLYILATGRVVGWIGHTMEQYQTPTLIRPRARYKGVKGGP